MTISQQLNSKKVWLRVEERGEGGVAHVAEVLWACDVGYRELGRHRVYGGDDQGSGIIVRVSGQMMMLRYCERGRRVEGLIEITYWFGTTRAWWPEITRMQLTESSTRVSSSSELIKGGGTLDTRSYCQNLSKSVVDHD